MGMRDGAVAVAVTGAAGRISQSLWSTLCIVSFVCRHYACVHGGVWCLWCVHRVCTGCLVCASCVHGVFGACGVCTACARGGVFGIFGAACKGHEPPKEKMAVAKDHVAFRRPKSFHLGEGVGLRVIEQRGGAKCGRMYVYTYVCMCVCICMYVPCMCVCICVRMT